MKRELQGKYVTITTVGEKAQAFFYPRHCRRVHLSTGHRSCGASLTRHCCRWDGWIACMIGNSAWKFFLSQYPEVDWKKAMGIRDIITHHYADLHAETVFYTCKRKIPPLLETVRKITRDLQ